MTDPAAFHLPHFLPYLLNQAAEAAGQEFQAYYRQRYGMLRTEWRVLFHLGLYGDLSAKEICDRALIHKTKVSRAVAALEHKRYLTRGEMPEDRRIARLHLTPAGQAVFRDLSAEAERFETLLVRDLSRSELQALRSSLLKLSNLPDPARTDDAV